jgi:hypothetical protein
MIDLARALIAVVVTAGCGLAIAHSAPTGEEVAELRRRGPAALDELLARYDATPPGEERQRLETLIDRVAAQRYATVSRLYWYTDLEEAKAAARVSGKPILSLRLLGRLDEDLSCANSRYFRVVLYANLELSRLLRDQVVLHWSSERPAPRVTIDMGDGRRMERTVAGNSIHYLLDAEGQPFAAIPGLVGPAAFRRELLAALPVARAVTAGRRSFHRTQMALVAAAWRRDGVVLAVGAIPADATLREAERITVGKSAVEAPLIDAVRLGPQNARVADDAAFWLAVADRHPERLDAQSRALMRRLSPTDWSAEPSPLDDAGFDRLVAAFERQLAADTALNYYRWGFEIHRWFADGSAPAGLEALNRRVYAELFLTPADDAWLGMATRGAFLGLPGDGIGKVATIAALPAR